MFHKKYILNCSLKFNIYIFYRMNTFVYGNNGLTTPTTSPLSQISISSWIIIVLLLSILGLNIFVYLAKGTDYLTDITGPIVKYFASIFTYVFGDVTKQIVTTSAIGTTGAVDITSGAIKSGVQTSTTAVNTGITNVQQATGTTDVNKPSQQIQQAKNTQLSNSLNNYPIENTNQYSFESDDATSSIQASKSSGKSGWCFIGEDRGFRSCIQVGENDTCMSGNIFPTNEICVNPNLRV
jgi:hypothetical protein